MIEIILIRRDDNALRLIIKDGDKSADLLLPEADRHAFFGAVNEVCYFEDRGSKSLELSPASSLILK